MTNIKLLLEQISSCIYNDKFSKKYEEQAINHPFTNVNILNKLLINDCYRVDDVLKNEKLFNEIKYLNEILETFYVDGMNPQKPYVPLYYFVDNNIPNNIKEAINDYISNSLTKRILQIGNKGSGKTITQNVFLHQENKWLEDNKIIWIRCDVHKIYQYLTLRNFKDLKSKNSKTNFIHDYLKIQLVYVFCKKWKENTFFNEIFKLLEKDDYIVKIQEDRSGDVFVDKLAIDVINKFYANIKNREQNVSSFSYGYDVIFNESIESNVKKAFNQWIQFSNALQKYLTDKNYHILWIVDGVDNVDYTKKSGSDIFDLLVHEIALLLKKKLPFQNQLLWVAMRPRTLIEVNNVIGFQQDTSNFLNQFLIVEINNNKSSSNILNEIFERRISYILSKINLDKKDNNKSIEVLNNILKTIINKDIGDKNILEKYHNNIRLYLYNRVGLLKLVYFRYLQLDKPINFNLSNQCDHLIPRSYFLNNRLFLRSERGFQVNNGDFCYNIFNIPFAFIVFEKRWPILLSTRIIQYYLYYKDSYKSIKSCVKYLNKYFNFDKMLIKFVINVLREFGMLDAIKYEVFGAEKNKLLLKISEKCIYIYNLIYSDIDVIYINSLDTHLPDFIINNNKVFDSYSNKLNTVTDYEYNCVKSVLSFLRYLIYINKVEESKCINMGLPQSDFNKIFGLPIHKNKNKYLKQINKYLSFFSKEKLLEFEEILKHI